MSDVNKIYISGVGMVTPVGANTAMTAASVRAGISAFQSSGFYLDEDNHIRMARVPKEALDEGLNEDLLPENFSARQIRLLQLATLAFNQLVPSLPQNVKLPLFLAGPEQLIEGDQPITNEFIELLVKQTGYALDIPMCRFISTGRAGGLAAINLAFRYLMASEHNLVIVGGVDTFYDGQLLQQLLANERLLVGGNMDGFIPGEAAAFILLSKTVAPAHKQTRKSISIYEPGLASEPGHRGSTAPYRGDGLATAVTSALNNAGNLPKVKVLYSSMNGESFFAKEHGVALIRNGERIDENIKIQHPADCFGDLGAAFGPVVTGISALNMWNNHIPSPCMICCSSDKDPRAAMILQS